MRGGCRVHQGQASSRFRGGALPRLRGRKPSSLPGTGESGEWGRPRRGFPAGRDWGEPVQLLKTPEGQVQPPEAGKVKSSSISYNGWRAGKHPGKLAWVMHPCALILGRNLSLEAKSKEGVIRICK